MQTFFIHFSTGVNSQHLVISQNQQAIECGRPSRPTTLDGRSRRSTAEDVNATASTEAVVKKSFITFT